MILTGWKLYAAAAVAGVTFTVGIFQAGIRFERVRGEAAELRVKLETIAADKRFAEKALDSASVKAAELAAEAKQKQEELDALRNKPESDRKPMSGAELDRLYPGG